MLYYLADEINVILFPNLYRSMIGKFISCNMLQMRDLHEDICLSGPIPMVWFHSKFVEEKRIKDNRLYDKKQ